MLARVKFYSGQGNTTVSQTGTNATAGSPVVIKRSAIVEHGEHRYVWWVSPVSQRLEQRMVTVGPSRGDDSVLITNGLNPGDVLVDQPDTNLQENQRVRSLGQ